MAVDPRLIALSQLRAQQEQMAKRGVNRGMQVGQVSPLRVANIQQRDAARQQASQAGKSQAALAVERQRAKAGGGGGGDQQGGRGIWGGIFNNPLTKTVLAPLQLMDIPRRVVISGVQELADAVNGGNADFGEFVSQARDSEFGFGDVVGSTGNKWLDRAIGFAGDVALDPLTYVTLGTAKIPGAAGRVATAVKAAEAGLGREVVEAAGRGGERALVKMGDQAVLDALKIQQPGLRFMGKRLPGTGVLDEAIGGTLARAKAPLIDSRAAQTMRKWGVSRDPELRSMMEAIATGGKVNPSDLDLLASARHVGAENARRARQRYTVGRYDRWAYKFGNQFRDDPSVIHAIEAGVDNEATRGWKDEAAKILQHQREEGASVGELADGKPYVPRIITDDARDIFDKNPSLGAPPPASSVGPEAQQFERRLVPRTKPDGTPFTYEIEGRQFTPVTGTIQEANDWAASVGLPKLYEDSPAKLAAAMVENAGKAVGDAAYLKKLMEGGRKAMAFKADSPLATRPGSTLAQPDTARSLVQQLQGVVEAPQAAAMAARDQAAGRLGPAYAANEAAQRAAQGLDQLVPNADRRAQEAAQRLSGAESQLANAPDVADELAAVSREGTDLAGQLRQVREAARGEVQGPPTLRPGAEAKIAEQEAIYDALTARHAQAQERLAALPADAAKGTRRLAEREVDDTFKQIVARRRAIGELWKDYGLPVEPGDLPDTSAIETRLRELGGRHGELTAQQAQRGPLEEQRLAARADQLETAQQAREAGQVAFEPEMAAAEAKAQLEGARLDLADTAQRVRDTAKKVTRAKSGLPGGDSYEDLHKSLTFVAENPDLFDEATTSLLDRYGKGVADLGDVDANAGEMSRYLQAIRDGSIEPLMERELNDGLTRLATDPLIGSDVAMRDEMVKVMRHFKAQTAAEPGALGKVVDAYTKFFKSWATATPGFHVRNAISAMFMNLTEGVGFGEMLDGNRIWRAFRKNPDGNWKAALPPELQEKADDVINAVYASGAGGRYTAAELGARAYGEGGGRRGLKGRASDNWATRRSHNVGEKIEGGVRAGLALHSLNEGGTAMDALMRIKRIHFDYSDVNETDQAMRRYIPFWTFMSRNLPLQVQQQWLKPRTYQQFASLKRNFNVDPTQAEFMPEWMKQEGAFRVGDNVAIAPDIGATQMAEQMAMLQNPARFLSQLNPAVKVPLELATNRDFFYGSQYKQNDFQKMGPETAIFGPLLQALGVAESTPEGTFTEKKFANAIYDLIPLLAQANRLGSTTSNREGMGGQSVANYLGVPLRLISPEAQDKEILYQRYLSTQGDPEQKRRAALMRALAEAG